MTQGIFIDNWTLQDVNDALEDGLPYSETTEIDIDTTAGAHFFNNTHLAIIYLDSLLSFLTNIVLREQLYVDENFLYTWHPDSGQLQRLTDDRIIVPQNFLADAEALPRIREEIVDRLCVTESIREITKRNQKEWRESRRQVDPFMSQIVLGGAGMLARSDLMETHYFGHPHRRRFFEKARFFSKRPDSTFEFQKIMETTRTKIIQYTSPNTVSKNTHFLLPPIAMEIIANCDDVGNLVSTALSLRDKYKRLREWLHQ